MVKPMTVKKNAQFLTDMRCRPFLDCQMVWSKLSARKASYLLSFIARTRLPLLINGSTSRHTDASELSAVIDNLSTGCLWLLWAAQLTSVWAVCLAIPASCPALTLATRLLCWSPSFISELHAKLGHQSNSLVFSHVAATSVRDAPFDIFNKN